MPPRRRGAGGFSGGTCGRSTGSWRGSAAARRWAIFAGSAPVAAAIAALSVAVAKAVAFSRTMPTASGPVMAPCDIRMLRRTITSLAATAICE